MYKKKFKVTLRLPQATYEVSAKSGQDAITLAEQKYLASEHDFEEYYVQEVKE